MTVPVKLCLNCNRYVTVGKVHDCPRDPCGEGYAQEKPTCSENDPDADLKNPTHYRRYTIEPLDFIEANGIPYSEGNVIKYICRWRYKDGVRDLKKAREYIDKIIEREGAA